MRPTRRALVKAVAGSLATFAVMGRNGHSLSQTAAGGLFAAPQPFTADYVLELARARAKKPIVEEKMTMPPGFGNPHLRPVSRHPLQSRKVDLARRSRMASPSTCSIPASITLRRSTSTWSTMASRRSSTMFPISSPSVLWCTKPTGEVDLHYAGFRLRYPINSKDYFDEFCVFQGASYFRAIGKGQLYGLSARGLAIDTGQPQWRGVSVLPLLLDHERRRRCGHSRGVGAARQPVGDRRLSLHDQARRCDANGCRDDDVPAPRSRACRHSAAHQHVSL